MSAATFFSPGPSVIQGFHQAVINNITTEVEETLRNYPNLVDWPDEHGFTALMKAGTEAMVRTLLAGHAQVNYIRPCEHGSGTTALIEACWEGRYDVARLLIQNGADVKLMPGDATALIAATWGGFVDTVSLLLAYGADIEKVTPVNTSAQGVANQCHEDNRENKREKYAKILSLFQEYRKNYKQFQAEERDFDKGFRMT